MQLYTAHQKLILVAQAHSPPASTPGVHLSLCFSYNMLSSVLSIATEMHHLQEGHELRLAAMCLHAHTIRCATNV